MDTHALEVCAPRGARTIVSSPPIPPMAVGTFKSSLEPWHQLTPRNPTDGSRWEFFKSSLQSASHPQNNLPVPAQKSVYCVNCGDISLQVGLERSTDCRRWDSGCASQIVVGWN